MTPIDAMSVALMYAAIAVVAGMVAAFPDTEHTPRETIAIATLWPIALAVYLLVIAPVDLWRAFRRRLAE